MPEAVSCHKTAGSPAIQCDPVLIGLEPDTLAQVAAQPSEGEPGVRSLVDGHAATLRVRKEERVVVDVAPPVGELARSCGVEAVATALAAASVQSQNPVVLALNVFRTVLDLGQCIDETLERETLAAQHQRAIELCKENGGEPIGFVLETLTCEVPPDHPLR